MALYCQAGSGPLLHLTVNQGKTGSMKLSVVLTASLALVTLLQSQAATTYSPGYSGLVNQTHTNSDNIISFDWDASHHLYYMTSSGFPDVNVWLDDGGVPLQNIYSEPNNFVGASLLTIGSHVYFNDSTFSNTQNIWKYSIPGSTTSLASTTSNSNLSTDGSDLFIAGSGPVDANHLYHSALDASGDLSTDPATDLGGTGSGNSGPLSLDSAGNLYYAPGFNDKSIYKWSAFEVAEAIADPINDPLSLTGALWKDYSSDFANVSGGTGIAFDDDGDLVLSLTDFSNPSLLVEFEVDSLGNYDGHSQILSTTGRLGDVRFANGSIFFANDNQIIQVIPEPSTTGLLLLATAGFAFRRSRASSYRASA